MPTLWKKPARALIVPPAAGGDEAPVEDEFVVEMTEHLRGGEATEAPADLVEAVMTRVRSAD